MLLGRSNKDELVGVTSQDTLDRLSEIVKVVLDGRENDCHILRSISRLFRDRPGLVAEMRDDIDEETNITP